MNTKYFVLGMLGNLVIITILVFLTESGYQNGTEKLISSISYAIGAGLLERYFGRQLCGVRLGSLEGSKSRQK